MKKLLVVILALVLALGIAIPVSANDDPALIADGGSAATAFTAGTVTVTDDGTNLTVTYNTTGGWVMNETHLYVGDSLPTKSAPGRFPYKHEGLGGLTTDSYTVPLPAGTVYIAAQAVVILPGEPDPETGIIPWEETAWAEGSRIRPGKNWAMYFVYD